MNWQLNPRIAIAAKLLHSGQVIAYPTEGVWGLGCDPMNERAVADILALKGRAASKGLIVIAASVQQLLPYIGLLSANELARLAERRAVPTTWIVPRARNTPLWLTGGRNTVAVRITDHPLSAALCRTFGGALVSTSANPSGKPAARTALKVRQYFRGQALFIVPGPLGGAAKPSEIRDLHSGEILRGS